MTSALATKLALEAKIRKSGRKEAPGIDPSRVLEAKYRSELLKIVARLAKAVNVEELANAIEASKTQDGTMDNSIQTKANKVIARALKSFNPLSNFAENLATKTVAASEKANRRAFIVGMQSALGIDVTTLLKEGDLVNVMQEQIKENVALIKSIPEQYLAKLEKGVNKALVEQNGKALKAYVKQLNKTTESRAKLIARDQMAKFNLQLSKTRQQNMGIVYYRWVTSRDERVRDSHRKNDGKIFSWTDPPATTGHPGEDIQCRCVAKPVLDLAPEDKVTPGTEATPLATEGMQQQPPVPKAIPKPTQPREQGNLLPDDYDHEAMGTFLRDDSDYHTSMRVIRGKYLRGLQAGDAGDIDNHGAERVRLFKKSGLNKLSENELSALGVYTRSDYEDINKFLFDPKFKARKLKDDPERAGEIQNMADYIYATIRKSPKTSLSAKEAKDQNLWLRRRERHDNDSLERRTEKYEQAFLNGTTVETQAFLSAARHDGNAFSGNLTFRILPRGHNGVDVQSVSDHFGEKEIVFNRGSRFKVVDIQTKKTRFRHEKTIFLEEVE